MKKCLLLSVAIIISSGCLHHSPYYYDHDVTITLKNDVPCFGLADDEQVRSEQAKIYFLTVTHPENTIPQKQMMNKFMNNAVLQSGECVPYEGEMLKNNLLYPVSFSVFIENQRHNEGHSYVGLFCLSEKKNGKKILHHFKKREHPTSCPMGSNE